MISVSEEAIAHSVGLRSLSPAHPNIRPKFWRYPSSRRRLPSRHVRAWLIGPFFDAWLKVHPTTELERAFLEVLAPLTRRASVDQRISMPTPPFTPRGCVRNLSVADVSDYG